jgi:hypothetical protein
MDQVVHIVAEHLLPLIAEHLECGPVDEGASALAIHPVDALPKRIQQCSALELNAI